MSDHRIRLVERVDVLTETYVPETLHARDEQIRTIEKCLAPGQTGRSRRNLWLYGKPGTGKTSAAQHVLSLLQGQRRLPSAYVNCWQHSTLHSVVDTVNQQLRVLETGRSDTQARLDRLRGALNGRAFIAVLDEIDLAPPKERNRIIYNLLDLPRAGVVCICNSRYPLVTLDPRTKSRLRPEPIEFPEYSVDQLEKILVARATEALSERAWKTGVLRKIATVADGDARVAIQTLRTAAETADRLGHPEIKNRHVQEGWQEAKHLKHRYVIEHLGRHHQLLYTIVREAGTIASAALRKEYEKRCSKNGQQPVAVRTFQSYLQSLIRLRLLRAERAPVHGGAFIYSLED